MPIQLTAGISKKLGLPGYSSEGASCHLEVELPPTLLNEGVDAFHEQVRRVFDACRAAVEEELACHQADH
jgi:hypothetical protein